MDKNKIQLGIAGVDIQIQTEQLIYITEEFEPFLDEIAEIQATENSILVKISSVERLPETFGEKICEKSNFYVYVQNGILFRYYNDFETKTPYACNRLQNDCMEVVYLKEEEARLQTCSSCFLHMAFEELLLRKNRMIFHSSCITTDQGGILFSGPSGIGKSTQADLWKEYEGSTIINGDRTILYQKNGIWMASGSPYAGSSGYYVNKQIPVRAIVMLEQATECKVRRLKPAEAFRNLYAGMIVNSWNVEYVSHICDFCQLLAMEVPIYHMACTPDETAIAVLKEALKEVSN